jgi:transcriptional regulatory protein LevR
MGEIDNLEINVTEKDKKAEQKDEKMLDELKIDEKVSSTTKTEQTIDEMKKEFQDLQSKRGRKLDEKVMVKICDMGNGCWTHHHFTPEIQTR